MLKQALAALSVIAALTTLAGCTQTGSGSAEAPKPKEGDLKIGFIVKQPEEQWFQDEWKFAKQAGEKNGFEVITLEGQDGEKVDSAIDNLNAQGVKGFIICVPDVKLGPSILSKAESYGMKVMSVDDQFVGADGKFMDVHHMGISARDIGKGVGQALYDEMTARKWSPAEVGLLVPTFKQLDTARERTDGAIEAITAAGFPKAQIYEVAQKTSDVPGGIDAANIAITQHPTIKKWLVCGMNDEAVLGSIRALEDRKFKAEDVIGIGIGGTKTAQDEFAKSEPTGFFGTMLISPKRHGYETAELMYKWLAKGEEPPKSTFTKGILIKRDDYQLKLKEEGLAD
jgi:L-arabinose transport system substrate-binding protein